ncbi:MAG: hypothetical protein HKN68_04710 [Saprospiraceae bacterium]|nr:hypothetical protein [Saprospiraceae bacterium]
MITKEKLYKQIESFPDELEIEELIERLLLIDKLEKRKIESDNDDTVSEGELDNEIKGWLEINKK